jgi:hypothetical protein
MRVELTQFSWRKLLVHKFLGIAGDDFELKAGMAKQLRATRRG